MTDEVQEVPKRRQSERRTVKNAKRTKVKGEETEAPSRQTRQSNKVMSGKKAVKRARTVTVESIDSDEEVQSTTVTSSNDHSTAAAAVVTTADGQQRNHDTGYKFFYLMIIR